MAIYDHLNSEELRDVEVDRDGSGIRITRQVRETDQHQRVLTLLPDSAIALAAELLRVVLEIRKSN